MREWILTTMSFVIMIGAIVCIFLAPYFEAKSFNDCTGGNASYITALTTELRVENCQAKGHQQ